MIISNAAFAATALEIRLVEARMASRVARITQRENWNGSDRDVFEREWNELVKSRLHNAASAIEGISLMPFA